MIEITTFAERQIAVFGLGRSGLAVAQALAAGGAKVRAWDDSESRRADAVAAGHQGVAELMSDNRSKEQQRGRHRDHDIGTVGETWRR